VRIYLAALATIFYLGGCASVPQEKPDTGTVIYAVGDIADCGKNPPQEAAAVRTAELLRQTEGPILALGDIAYPIGSYTDFATCFDQIWGDLKARILPAPGNHEYLTAQATPYYAYFGAAAGEPGRGYYSTTIGAWHIVSLNSNIDTQAGSPQEVWLRADLAANRAKCTLAFWHHPVFSSTPRGFDAKMQDIWRALYEAGVDVVLNGHEHVYERFAALTPDGKSDTAHGIRQFVVGTGGARAGRFDTIQAASESRETKILGVLRLTLRDNGYAWQYLPAGGQKFDDSGEDHCHD
jgi:3',5'-cyclic AMP phosphodiesterase CpdA